MPKLNSLLKSLWFICLFVLALTLLWSCRPDKEKLDLNPGLALEFSTDTITFDTVFTNFPTATRRLRVYNRNKNAIKIAAIDVAGQGSSPFSINVNGIEGPKSVRNLTIQGQDSFYVLITARINATDRSLPFIVKDSLLFQVEGRATVQDVKLLSYGQDAIFIDRLRGDTIACNTVWTNVRPYVIFNSTIVPEGCTLTIKEGVRVHFFQNSNLFVAGTLLVEGTRENPVVFQGTRLERFYENIPGQWGAIVLLDSSGSRRPGLPIGLHFINHAIIKNGLHGVQVNLPGDENPTGLIISNSQIQNMSGVGLYGFSSLMLGYNNVVVDCAQNLVACLAGGSYEFWHNTFAYSGVNNFSRDLPGVIFADHFDDRSNPVILGQLGVGLYSNIINGGQEREFAIAENLSGRPIFDTLFNNMVKTNEELNNGLNRKDNLPVPGRTLTFRNPFRYDFRLDSLSPAQDKGLYPLPSAFEGIRRDKQENTRGSTPPDLPDLGAYEWKPR